MRVPFRESDLSEHLTIFPRVVVNSLRALAAIGRPCLPPVARFCAHVQTRATRWLFVVLTLVAPVSHAIDGQMYTPGSMNVSASGALHYSIPIQVPPGTAGMTPSLSLEYNSQNANGIAGVGWSLSGISTISRCPRTLATDTVHGGVNFDANDRFCLDGSRLIAIKGVDGADQTEYRTEIDTFSKIVSYGVAGSGPSWFKVWTKSGNIVEYGNMPDSKFLVPGQAYARTWSINKVTDVVGNYMTYAYTQYATGEALLTEIDYTLNPNTVPAISAPFNKILLTYGTRPDQTSGYVATSNVRVTQRLINIQTFAGKNFTTPVRTYALNYGTSPQTGRSLLQSIQESVPVPSPDDGSVNSGLAGVPNGALPATQMTYSTTWPGIAGGSTTFQLQQTVTGDWQDNYYGIVGDFNGDGAADLVLAPKVAPFTWYFCPGPAIALSGNSCSTMPAMQNVGYYNPLVGDFNGDGVADLIVSGKVLYGANISNPVAFGTVAYASPIGVPLFSTPVYGYAGDFNGDGISDLVATTPYSQKTVGLNLVTTPATTTLYLGTTTKGAFTTQSMAAINAMNSPYGPINYDIAAPGDYNGDGITDLFFPPTSIVSVSSPTTQWYSSGYNNCLAPVLGCAAYGSGSSGAITRPLTVYGDFDGDGKTDSIVFPGPGNLATSASFCPAPALKIPCSTIAGTSGWYGVNFITYTGDFNGDGMLDLLLVGPTATYVCLGPGIAVANNCVLAYSGNLQTFDLYVGDFNGDGQTDLYLIGKTASYFVPGAAFRPDLMTDIRTGIGGNTHVQYNAMTYASTLPNGTPFYSVALATSYPTASYSAPVPLVYFTASSTDNGDWSSGHPYTVYHYYGDAKVDATGRGFLGFHQHGTYDAVSGIGTLTTAFQQFPFTGMTSSTSKSLGNTTVESTVNTVVNYLTTTGGRIFPYIATTMQTSADLDGTALPSVTSTFAYDTDGNATSVQVQHSDGFTKLTVNGYQSADYTNWILGRLSCTAVTNSVPGSSPATRTSAFSYFTNGLLKQEIIEPGLNCSTNKNAATDVHLRLITDYQYTDNAGNKTSVTVHADPSLAVTDPQYAAPRQTTYSYYDATYSPYFQFPVSVTKILSTSSSQTTTSTFDNRFGTVTSVTDPNGIKSSVAYDNFGRKVADYPPDYAGQNTTETRYSYTFILQPSGWAYETVASKPGAPSLTEWRDALGRITVRDYPRFDNSGYINEYSGFDDAGHLTTQWRPSSVGSFTYSTTYQYDALNRLHKQTAPDNGTITITPSGLTTTVTNALNQKTVTVQNSQGQKVSVTNAQGTSDQSVVTFAYDPFGNVLSTSVGPSTTSLRQVTAATYDVRGRKITSNDSDMGSWSYVYNVFGELVSQTNANNQTSTFQYDNFGRMTQRTTPDTVAGVTTTWTWDQIQKGKLTKAQSSDGITRTYLPDGYGRDYISFLEYGANTDPGYTEFIDIRFYDSNGRVSNTSSGVFYAPLSATFGSQFFYGKYNYSASGYPQEVVQTDSSGALIGSLWKAAQQNDDLRVTAEAFGNGLTGGRSYDPAIGRLLSITAGGSKCAGSTTPTVDCTVQNYGVTYDLGGNVRTRADNISSVGETFGFDNLNRLVTVASTAGFTGSPAPWRYTYDAHGNILTKVSGSDSWTYSYSPTGSIHQLNGVTGTKPLDGYSNPAFQYDANGNLKQEASGTNKLLLTYTSFNMPLTISAPGASMQAIYYGPDHERVRETTTTSPAQPTDGSVYYYNAGARSGAHMELHVTAANVAEIRYFLHLNGSSVAQVTKRSTGVNDIRYLHSDHLGSLSVVTNETGGVVERLSYDPWGRRRNTNGSNDPGSSVSESNIKDTVVPHGYTEHEMLDSFGLIHMNARLQSPSVGRFITADTALGGPASFTQSYNRYAYCMNNPVTCTDPTGHGGLDDFIFKVFDPIGNAFEQAVPTILVVGFTSFLGPEAFALAGSLGTSTAIAQGMIGGFLLGMSSGDLNSAVAGIVTGGTFAWIGDAVQEAANAGKAWSWQQKVFVKAVAGGATGMLRHQSFLEGALGAGFGEAAGLAINKYNPDVVTKGIAEIVAGGTASAIGGGKFANGAVTAAYNYLFNYCNHNGCWTTKDERAFLDRGDFLGYYSKACEGGDLNACGFYGIASGERPGPSEILMKGLIANGYSFSDATKLVQSTIPLNLANDYANLLPQSQSQAAFPSAQAITDYHWTEFDKYGLSPSTFGGSPLGKSVGPFLPGIWCPLCR